MKTVNLWLKKYFQGVLFVVALIVLSVLIATCLYRFRDKAQEQFLNASQRTLTEIAISQKIYFESSIFEQFDYLQLVERIIKTEGWPVAVQKLDSQNFAVFENIALATADGEAMYSTGQKANVTDFEPFKTALSGEQVVSSIVKSPITGENVIVMAVPIKDFGEVHSVLWGEFNDDYLNSLFATSFENDAIYVLSDMSGEIITQKTTEYGLEITNILETLEHYDFEGDINAQDVIDSLAAGESVDVAYSIGGVSRYGSFHRLNDTPLVVFVVVAKDVLSKEIVEVERSIGILIVEVVICIGFITILLTCMQLAWAKRMQKALDSDEFTEVYNLKKFKTEITKVLKNNTKDKYIIIKLDMINFKAVNELYGHEIGNEVIRKIAQIGKDVKVEGFIQARVGVDEFIIFAPESYFMNFDDLRLQMEAKFKGIVSIGDEHDFKFRYGRYKIEKGECDADEIVNKVTMAHHITKESGISLIVDYDEKFKERLLMDAEITNSMESALRNNEFKVFLQPKFKIKTREIVGAEALVRWIKADGTMVYPDQFIPVFERNKFILTLDKFMLSQVCAYLRERIDNGKKYVPISVNFSRTHLQHEYTVYDIISIVDSANIPRKLIEIELTESVALEGTKKVKAFEKALHDNNFKISMDDFGTGYSSFATLQDIDFDVIKLDKSFMPSEEIGEKSHRIVRSMVQMVKTLGKKSVAEGVETEEQFELLQEMGCDIAQGYLLSRPVDISSFNDMLNEQNNKE